MYLFVVAFGLIGLVALLQTNAASTDINSPTPSSVVAPSDLNNDGVVNIFDLSTLLSKWNTSDTVSDINKDGTVNIFDLSTLLSAWGSVSTTPTPTPVVTPTPTPSVTPTPVAFRFASLADTKSGLTSLSSVVKQAWTYNPKFLLYPGDLCESGPEATCFNAWKTAFNSGGDFYNKSFVSRGNHDSAGTAFWSSTFNFANIANNVGATNFTGNTLSYSFDYGNSHFVAIDDPGGSATSITSSQITWADNDITAAEARGVVHTFLFFHGPPVPIGGHCCTNAPAVITMLSKHNSVAATFNGHEHNQGYVHVDSRWGNTGHVFEEFVTGGGGASLVPCERGDFCDSSFGFTTIDVNGATVTANIYKLGSNTPIKTVTFTH